MLNAAMEADKSASVEEPSSRSCPLSVDWKDVTSPSSEPDHESEPAELSGTSVDGMDGAGDSSSSSVDGEIDGGFFSGASSGDSEPVQASTCLQKKVAAISS